MPRGLDLTFPPIGVMKTCFAEKFGAPRQSLMVPEARGILKLAPEPAYRVALHHLEDFSHLWVVFVFDRHRDQPWRPTIRPPRLDAPRRVGVFASRSPHRPNPIGLSVLKLERVDREARGGIEIHFSGVDLLDGTPVLDIKPYLPFADRVPDARGAWTENEIPRYPVAFSPASLARIDQAHAAERPRIRALIAQMLELDPRPTSQRRAMPIEDPKSEGLAFGFRVLDYDVQWRIEGAGIYVTELI